jgi:hypothetical protein
VNFLLVGLPLRLQRALFGQEQRVFLSEFVKLVL